MIQCEGKWGVRCGCRARTIQWAEDRGAFYRILSRMGWRLNPETNRWKCPDCRTADKWKERNS